MAATGLSRLSTEPWSHFFRPALAISTLLIGAGEWLPIAQAADPASPSTSAADWAQRPQGLVDTSRELDWRAPAPAAPRQPTPSVAADSSSRPAFEDSLVPHAADPSTPVAPAAAKRPANSQQLSAAPVAAVTAVSPVAAPPQVRGARRTVRPRLLNQGGTPTPVGIAPPAAAVAAPSSAPAQPAMLKPVAQPAARSWVQDSAVQPAQFAEPTETSGSRGVHLGTPAEMPSILQTLPTQELEDAGADASTAGDEPLPPIDFSAPDAAQPSTQAEQLPGGFDSEPMPLPPTGAGTTGEDGAGAGLSTGGLTDGDASGTGIPADVPPASELPPAEEGTSGSAGDEPAPSTDLNGDTQSDLPEIFRDDEEGDAESPAAVRAREEESWRKLREAAIADCASESASCELTRKEIIEASIDSISLDISPLLVTSASDMKSLECDRERNLKQIPTRVWKNRRGEVLAEGQVIDYTNGRLVIREASGETRRIEARLISEEDRCFLAAWWRIPSDCQLPEQSYAGRCWAPSTMTWTASALCHKPLYFEDVQLERYGHSQGPILQPLLSGAHFFGNVFMLPYNIGLHPPQECQYALGYYRPGDCAPWLIPAFPLHPRAARMQASFLLGGIGILP